MNNRQLLKYFSDGYKIRKKKWDSNSYYQLREGIVYDEEYRIIPFLVDPRLINDILGIDEGDKWELYIEKNYIEKKTMKDIYKMTPEECKEYFESLSDDEKLNIIMKFIKLTKPLIDEDFEEII